MTVRGSAAVVLVHPSGARVTLNSEESALLLQHLVQSDGNGAGKSLSAALEDARGSHRVIDFGEDDEELLRAALFRIGATLRLSRGLQALQGFVQ